MQRPPEALSSLEKKELEDKKKEKAKKLLRIESAEKSITIQKHFGPKYFVRSTCCAFSHPKKNSLAVKQLTSLPTNYKRKRKILFNNI